LVGPAAARAFVPGPARRLVTLGAQDGSNVPTGPHEQALGFAAEETDGTVIVVLTGELDHGNEARLASELERVLARRPRRLVFDMAQVSFVSCAAARLLADTGRSLPEGVQPVLSGLQPIVFTVFRVTGLDALCVLTAAPLLPMCPGEASGRQLSRP
jgi:anti-anti-sigma factor